MQNRVDIVSFDMKAHVNQWIIVKAYYLYNMTNNYNVKRNYTGYVDLSIDNQHVQNKINFSLEPDHSKKLTNQLIFIKYKAIQSGTFPILARIKITDSFKDWETDFNAELIVTLT